MRKSLILLLTLMLAACGPSADGPEIPSQNGNAPGGTPQNGNTPGGTSQNGDSADSFSLNREELIGQWKVTEAKYDAGATLTAWEYEDTFATFHENGRYEGSGHFGTLDGVYSIEGNTITVLTGNQPVILYEVTALSEGHLEWTATLLSNGQQIWMVCINEESLEVSPISVISDETFFQSEANARIYLSSLYDQVTHFISAQRGLEDKLLACDFSELTPGSSVIKDLWALAYKILRLTNEGVNALRKDDVSFTGKDGYLCQLKVIRGFVAYNLAVYWGSVPFATSAPDITGTLPVQSRNDILLAAISDLNVPADYQMSGVPQNRIFNAAVASFLRAECYLTLGKTGDARLVLDHTDPADEVFFQYRSGEEWIPLLSKPLIGLLALEAALQTEGLPEKWQQEGLFYGYWAMLGRIGKSADYLGCQDHQLLLPIPISELTNNPDLTQNPGY